MARTMPERADPVSIRVESVVASYGTNAVLRDVSLVVEPSEIVALLGPSGCGKTTLLRAIAGLEPVTSGSIALDDSVVSSSATHLAPERRRVGMVFQDWALFPHLTVAQNVAYGLPRPDRRGPRVAQVLDMVGLSGLEARSPHTLSGGQQQRVALARALAPQPSVLLLDEPFSNLDAALRVEIRTEVHRLLEELDVTAVFVTHDQDEAFVMGNRVAVMREGEIVQWGTPAELYSRPVTPWIARFVGEANLIAARASGTVAESCIGPIALAAPSNHAAVSVLVRPEQLDLHADGPAVVELVEYYGHDTTYEVVLSDGERVRVRLASTPRFERGDSVQVSYIGTPTLAYEDTAADAHS